eukprot:2978900-Lingulodinium_polyedra.AAC.1
MAEPRPAFGRGSAIGSRFGRMEQLFSLSRCAAPVSRAEAVRRASRAFPQGRSQPDAGRSRRSPSGRIWPE